MLLLRSICEACSWWLLNNLQLAPSCVSTSARHVRVHALAQQNSSSLFQLIPASHVGAHCWSEPANLHTNDSTQLTDAMNVMSTLALGLSHLPVI